MTDELPPGWAVTRLESLIGPEGLMTDGDWVESKDQDPNGEIRLVQLADVGDGVFLDKSNRFLTQAKAEELDCTFLQTRDVLISRLGEPLGKTCLFPELEQPCVTVVDVHVVRPTSSEISREWLVHLLNSAPVRRVVDAQSSGTTRKRITGQKLKDLEVRVAPAPEQQRIASKIDELFSRIDEGERALERVQKLVERYRQSVLKAAVTGELTRDWRENNKDQLESGEALLARILKARREAWEKAELDKMKAKGITPASDKWKQKYEEPAAPETSGLPELPAGWVWASVDQLCKEFGNGLSKKPSHHPPGIPILRISAVRPLSVDASDLRYYVPEDNESVDAFRVSNGDLLFTRYNGSPALVAVSGVYRGAESVLHPDKLIRARVASEQLVQPDFLVAVLNCGPSKKHLDQWIKTSAGQHGIAGSDIKRAPVPLSPTAEQDLIIDLVSVVLSKCADVATTTDVQLRRAQANRQAILCSAFAGRLLPQDPNDEPASALLERIAAERNDAPAKPKRGRKPKTSEPA